MKLWIRTPVALAALATVVSFAACSDDTDPTGGDEDPLEEATVEMQDNIFDPDEILLKVGGTVTWVNVGENDHTTTGDDWDSGNLDPDETHAETFSTVGEFDYVCTIHDGMEGTITVVETE